GETPAYQYYLEMVPMGSRGRIICYLQKSGTEVESYYRIPSNVNLTPRESDVISFLVRGSDNATIARQMGIGIYTVKDHLKSIFQKLDVHTRAGAVALLTRGVRPTPVEDSKL
ncbi:MAG: helix-turn-helix transcriptional regulator, partial [Planctomycetota bacterium]